MVKTSTKICMGIMGVAMIALGIYCLSNPGATLLSLALFIAIATIVSGVSSICVWARARKFLRQSGTLLLSGVLEILLGVIFLWNTPALAVILPIVFAIWILVDGICIAIRSTDFKAVGFKYWWVLLILGLGATGLGLASFRDPLMVGGTAICLIVSIAIMLLGVVELIALFGVNKFEKKTVKWLDSANQSVDEQ